MQNVKTFTTSFSVNRMKNQTLKLFLSICFVSVALVGCGKKAASTGTSVAVTAPATEKLIPPECENSLISGSSLNRNERTYDDPPIQALINQGSYKIQKMTSETTSGGKVFCNAFLNVNGIFNGNSYNQDVTVWAYPPR